MGSKLPYHYLLYCTQVKNCHQFATIDYSQVSIALEHLLSAVRVHEGKVKVVGKVGYTNGLKTERDKEIK